MGKNKFRDRMIAEGHCDERGAAFAAKCTKAPNGEYGLVLLAVKGNHLYISDIDFHSNVGDLFYDIELSKITDLKIRTFFFAPLLRFKYKGEVFSFTNMVMGNETLEVIKSEIEKQG